MLKSIIHLNTKIRITSSVQNFRENLISQPFRKDLYTLEV